MMSFFLRQRYLLITTWKGIIPGEMYRLGPINGRACTGSYNMPHASNKIKQIKK